MGWCRVWLDVEQAQRAQDSRLRVTCGSAIPSNQSVLLSPCTTRRASDFQYITGSDSPLAAACGPCPPRPAPPSPAACGSRSRRPCKSPPAPACPAPGAGPPRCRPAQARRCLRRVTQFPDSPAYRTRSRSRCALTLHHVEGMLPGYSSHCRPMHSCKATFGNHFLPEENSQNHCDARRCGRMRGRVCLRKVVR